MKLFTKGLIFAVLGIVLSQCAQKTLERPNILFITTDYTRGADLPVTGAPFLKAPALEKLCSEGLVFTHHCCNAPICMPSRATIATGHFPHRHSLWDNRSIPVRQEGLPFLIDELKKADYQTIGIGKMHFHPFKADYNYDLRITLETKGQTREDDYEKYLIGKGTSREEIFQQLKTKTEFPVRQSFHDWDLDEELHPDVFVGAKTVETVESGFLSEEKPWFLWMSFTGPHNPWNAPKRLADYYREMDDLPLGDFVEGELETKPIHYTRHRYGYGGNLMQIYDKQNAEIKEEIRRGVKAGHYGLLSLIDEQISDVMDALEEKDQLSETMIIFTSDHGSALFDNEMLHKGSAFPTQAIVPFVVWYPDVIESGFVDGFTSHADLFATFLELAGTESVPPNEGHSFVNALLNPEVENQDYTVVECTMVSSIMTNDWLAGFHHMTGEIELYDLEKDPMCHFNIVDGPGNKSIVDSLKTQLVNWRKACAKEGEMVDDDIFKWFEELGDSTHVRNYFNGYKKEFEQLTKMENSAPGVTGEKASKILQ